MSLKDKIDKNELDLSLNQLTEVPVKELAALTKATHLDLSCNHLKTVPREFSTLTHLVKLDLSNNKLVELPDNFGNLYNLQSLDLYSNQLENLPVSFCRLKNLRWLDLKNNPLEPKLKAIAGDCLDEKDCQACAKKVVSYFQTMDSDMEREKQKMLKAVREKEAFEKAQVEKMLEEQRKLKKLEREKRKAESKAKREAEMLSEKKQLDNEEIEDLSLDDDGKTLYEEKSNKGGNICIKIFMFILLICLTFLLFYLLVENNLLPNSISNKNIKDYLQEIVVHLNLYGVKITKLLKYYIPIIRGNTLRFVHQYMISMSNIATHIEEIVAVYFQ